MEALPEFERTRILLDAEELARLASAHELAGGGVGSYCVESLARAGVRRLSLSKAEIAWSKALSANAATVRAVAGGVHRLIATG